MHPSEWLLAGAAGLFLAAYALPILRPGLSDGQQLLCLWVTWSTWAIFALDFVVRASSSGHVGRYVRGHLPDLLLIAVPVFRPLRLLRLVTLLSILNRGAGGSLRGRVVLYIVSSTSLLAFIAALAILDAERASAEANIETFGDSLWWAVTTMTTVGYGDQYPVTTTGRWIAAGLMIAGIALLGAVTATLASWLIDRVSAIETETQAATRRDVHALAVEIAHLREQLAIREGIAPADDSTDTAGP